MISTSITRTIIVLFVSLPCLSATSLGRAEEAGTPESWLALLSERNAGLRGDKATWRRHIAPECWWIGAGGLKLATFAEVEGSQADVGTERTIEGLVVKDYGSVAVLSYVAHEKIRQPSGTKTVRIRRLDTYARLGSEWKLVACAESLGRPPRRRIAADPAWFDQIAGKYQLDAGPQPLAIRVWREGEKLLIQPTGQPASELIPESETVFFDAEEDGEGSPDNIFVRGPNGEVEEYIYRAGEIEFKARRVR